MLRRCTNPLVAAKPNGPLWIAEDLFRDDRALLVDDDAVAPLSGDNHLSTALVDYLLQRSLQPTDLQDTTLVGSANSLHFFHQVNAKIATAPSDPNVAKSVENIRQRCSHYKDNKFEFLSPFCIDHHFVAVKIVFDLRSPDIFHEVSVYDSLIKGGRHNNSVHRNSPPAKYLRPFQQFIANFCLFGNPKCEVLLANPDHIVDKAVHRSCPRGTGSRLYFCTSHTGCCFRAKFGRERGTLPIIYKQELSNPFHCGEPVPPKTIGRAPKKRVRNKLEESVDHVIEVKDSTPVSKDVMKAAANIQSVRASYNQAYRAIGRAVANGPREKQHMSYLKHFQLRNEDSTVKAESDADQRLRRLGICPGIMRRSLQHVRPVLSLDGAHLLSKWKGTLYIASVQTACSNIYPVSFAILKDGEDAEGWKWHPDNRCRFCYFTVISDRQKGLIQALQQVFPDNHHCFCSVHIARNVEKEVRHCDNKHVRVCKLNGWRCKRWKLARVYQRHCQKNDEKDLQPSGGELQKGGCCGQGCRNP
ncbi:MULE transposase domain containing protein [Nitzschia inconspicua]|uniref:MULE transposase domain containing protein n=1 Tax=Nitzschia inconspicua TaxID=303405 RepID=A0A9K3L1L7_9STRA|nr:MULE transposase domain containing protein [Nitzschia inconspicua]